MSGSTTSLFGAPGTGKTILGLKFPEAGIRGGEPGAYFGFYETPDRLVGKAKGIGFRFTGGEIGLPLSALSATMENIILLRDVEPDARIHPLISILKVRESDYDSAVRECAISERGVEVADSCAGAARLLDPVILMSAGRSPSTSTDSSPSSGR